MLNPLPPGSFIATAWWSGPGPAGRTAAAAPVVCAAGVSDPAIEDRAVEVLALLADRGQHRSPSIPDLIIAATAELAGLTVLPLDKDFDVIAQITGQPMNASLQPETQPGLSVSPRPRRASGSLLKMCQPRSTWHMDVAFGAVCADSNPAGGRPPIAWHQAAELTVPRYPPEASLPG
jgi:hypothetical protein